MMKMAMFPGLPPRLRSVVSVFLVIAAFSCTPAQTRDIALEIEIHARAVAPGEPVRIAVVSPAALSSLDGTFLGEEVFFTRTTDPAVDGGAPEIWSGWAMVGLDGQPGSAVVELRGRAADGREAVGTRMLTVEGRDFPTEELSVSSKYVSPPPEVQERLAAERKKLARIYRTRTALPPAQSAFVRPVDGDPTSIFGTRRVFNGEPRSPHPGLDLRAAEGTPVKSSGAGRVVLAQDLYYSGNTVIIDHGGGLYTLYAHLSAIGVAEDDEVVPGQIVGESGATGRVTGPHLHWGAKIGNRPFDPRALLEPALFKR
ncbi:MAG: M23 family metallopeptidase [Acidobacteriota bacterium]|nr:M23 family metallopeptidase [Acidobacteriota bacterium]